VSPLLLGGELLDWKQAAERLKFDEGVSWTELAKRMAPFFPELSETHVLEKVRRALRRSERYRKSKAQEIEKIRRRYQADGSVVSEKFVTLQEGEVLSPEQLLELHGLDPAKWEIVNCIDNFWNSQVKGGRKQISYQSKLMARPRKKGIDLDDIDKHFAELERKHFVPPTIKPMVGDMMAEVNIADIHLGKLSWHGDTPENFDYKIARDLYYSIIGEIISEIKSKPIEYITFVWANDFFNSDTIEQTTTKGTRQDCDVRWQKMFNVGVEMLVRGIEMLSEIAPVKTFYTPSNHDEINGYHALKYLEAWFRRDSNVKIDTDAYPRKYQLYGNTLIGYCHGNKENSKGTREKASRLASAMPIEVPELWGRAKYREMHAAHLHSEQMIEEINGVIVRRISSPTALDTWHTTSGYIGAVRKAQTFVYHKERGLIHTINTPL
jgi:hypothetical protein